MITEVEYRHALGAYLLGALAPDEARELEIHVHGCASCHAELLDLGGVVADLAVAGPETARWPRGDDRAPAGSRRQLVAAAAVAAAVATATAAGLGFSAGSSSGGTPTALGTATATATATAVVPGTREIEGSSPVPAVAGRAVLVPASWGTSIELTLSGTQQGVGVGVECLLVVVSRSGERGTVGSWTVPEHSPTPAGERFKVPTSVPLGELAEVLVTTDDGTEVLVVPTA